MNKEEIINVIDSYNLDKDKFIVISGAALTLLDIIHSTNDIDIWCKNDYYEYLLNHYDCAFERVNEFGINVYMIDNIINFSTSFKPINTLKVNDINVSSLKDIINLKKYLNRSTDKELIKKLELKHHL